MVGKGKKGILTLLTLLVGAVWNLIPAQNSNDSGQVDSLLRLEKADYVEQFEQGDDLIRKVMNPVFFHNGTYLVCDSSLWSRNTNIINCVGNVRMTQGDAVLTSDKLDYIVDEDLAMFRGALVELRNRSGDVLRTRELDYNTRDSLAIFRNGAAMRSEDGQLIESTDGTFSNPQNYFTFVNEVNMYTDSVFVSTRELDYDADVEIAYFKTPIDFWKEENMLSADGGWYRRGLDLFFFRGDVHAIGKTQETWSDSLYYNRLSGDVEMRGKVQLQDSTRSVASVSQYLYYSDSLQKVTLLGEAAVALWEERENRIDTTYCGADTLIYRSLRMCDIDSAEIDAARQRKEVILGDPVEEFRSRAAQERADKENEARNQAVAEGRMAPGAGGRAAASQPRSARGASGQQPASAPPDSVAEDARAASGRTTPADSTASAAPLDSLKAPVPLDSLGMAVPLDSLGLAVSADSLKAPVALDSLELTAPLDSLAAAADSLAVPTEPIDTTAVGFAVGHGRVKIFRSDMQAVCDSLVFTELDSVARFYIEPIVWNEGRHQYTADSLFVLVKKSGIDRASLMSNSFIAVREDSIHFDQISSTEGLAFFDDSTRLRRFDALGNVSALFYLEENDELSTVNKAQSSMMSAVLKDGELQSVYYFESPKNDAYPVVQLSQSEQTVKGLNWRPQLRPKSKDEITSLSIRPSSRSRMLAKSRPAFERTEFYFEGYMAELYASLERARLRAEQRRAEAEAAEETAQADSLTLQDSLGAASLSDSLVLADSLGLADSLSVAADSLAAPQTLPDPRELKKAEREAARQARIDAREERWAALDARDEARRQTKERKAAERRMRREAKLRAREERRLRKEEALLQKYIEMYEKQKEDEQRKQKPMPTRERASGIEAGRELPAVIGPLEKTP